MKKYAVITIDEGTRSDVRTFKTSAQAEFAYFKAVEDSRPQDGTTTVMRIEIKQAYDGLDLDGSSR